MRYAMVIGLHADKVEHYKELHAAVWPDVLRAIRQNGVRDFSIFLKEPENLLFGTFLHEGDYTEAARRIDAEPAVQRWYQLTEPCQKPMPHRAEGEWWSFMDCVFHTE